MNVLFFQRKLDGTPVRSITPYNTNDLAQMALYQGMRATIGDSTMGYGCGMMIDDTGIIHKREEWTREITPPEPEPEEENENTEE